MKCKTFLWPSGTKPPVMGTAYHFLTGDQDLWFFPDRCIISWATSTETSLFCVTVNCVTSLETGDKLCTSQRGKHVVTVMPESYIPTVFVRLADILLFPAGLVKRQYLGLLSDARCNVLATRMSPGVPDYRSASRATSLERNQGQDVDHDGLNVRVASQGQGQADDDRHGDVFCQSAQQSGPAVAARPQLRQLSARCHGGGASHCPWLLQLHVLRPRQYMYVVPYCREWLRIGFLGSTAAASFRKLAVLGGSRCPSRRAWGL